MLAGLVEDVGAGVRGVTGGRLDGEGVRRERLGLAPPLLVLADEGELAGVPPVVAVAPTQALDERGGLATGGEATEGDGRYGDAHRERVAREQPDVAQQRGRAGGLVGAEPGVTASRKLTSRSSRWRSEAAAWAAESAVRHEPVAPHS